MITHPRNLTIEKMAEKIETYVGLDIGSPYAFQLLQEDAEAILDFWEKSGKVQRCPNGEYPWDEIDHHLRRITALPDEYAKLIQKLRREREPKQDAAPEQPAAADGEHQTRRDEAQESEPSPEASPPVSGSELAPETVPDQMSEQEPALPVKTRARKKRGSYDAKQRRRAKKVLQRMLGDKEYPAKDDDTVDIEDLKTRFKETYNKMVADSHLSRVKGGAPSWETAERELGWRDTEK